MKKEFRSVYDGGNVLLLHPNDGYINVYFFKDTSVMIYIYYLNHLKCTCTKKNNEIKM